MKEQKKKASDEVPKYRRKYEQALQEMNKYIPTVDEWMRSMFIKCQEMEEIRLRFFKKVLFSVQRKLNVTRSPEYEKKL